MVFSSTRYRNGELNIKAITINTSTRVWELKTVRPFIQYSYYYSSSASYDVCFTLPGAATPTGLSYTPGFIDASGWYKDGEVYYPITKIEFTGGNKLIKIYYLHPQNGEMSSDAISSPGDIKMRTR